MKRLKKRTDAVGVGLGSLVGFFLAVFVFSSPVMAQPVISGVTGTVANGQAITVTGSAFGATGPTVTLFDDFELGSNGATLHTGAGSAQVGQWTPFTSIATGPTKPYPVYSSTSRVSGTFACNAPMSFTNYKPIFEAALPSGPVFVSYWVYLPAGEVCPGQSPGDYKLAWLGGATAAGGADQTIPTWLGNTTAFACNAPSNYTGYLKGFKLNNNGSSSGTWTRIWVYAVPGSSSNGTFKFWDMALNSSPVTQEFSATGITNVPSGAHWALIDFNADANFNLSGQMANPYFDDIYIATGTGAQARVEIGNASTYAACTNLTIVTPTSWSASSITGTVRQGAFTTGQSAYLYVTDANGNVNAQGQPVTMGASGGSTTPPPTSPPPTAGAPAVSITSPASGTTTTQSSVTLQGTAAETNGSITAVTWTNSLGGNGIATCSSTTWSATAALQQGANVITVTATDAAGKTATTSVTVTYSTSTSGGGWHHRRG